MVPYNGQELEIKAITLAIFYYILGFLGEFGNSLHS